MSDEQLQEEESARKSGWVPKEEFNGDPAIWRDAKEFNERGKEIAGIQTERLESANKKIDNLEKQMSTFMNEQKKEREEFMEYNKKRDAVALKKAKADLQADQRKAVEEQDTAAYDLAQKKIDKIEVEEVEIPKKKTVQEDVDVHYEGFVKDNAWYNDDVEMTVFADTAARILSSKGDMMSDDFFGTVVKQVKEKFPEKFENGNRDLPGAVDTGGKPKKTSGKKGYSGLPKEAREQCDQFCKTIPGFTKESFLEHYEGEAV